MTESQAVVDQEDPEISFAEFLENVPPSTHRRIIELWKPESSTSIGILILNTPEIQLHCSTNSCNGVRFFIPPYEKVKIFEPERGWKFYFLTYTCANCRVTQKVFSLAVRQGERSNPGHAYKLGELPVYGPPTPSRLISLIGPDRETLLKGRRCENQGLGVGAFVYYRRVIENQKNRIISEVMRVAEKIGAKKDILDSLSEAKAEQQFSTALAAVKVPDALLINGHNPLTLLHSALSDGLHARSDKECLELASSVRVVLAELSERLGQVLKDEAELQHAIAKLKVNKKEQKVTTTLE
jgi:hypothetical protein